MNLLRELARCRDQHHLRCSDGPDMTPMYEAAKLSADLGREALDYYKAKDAEMAPAREQATDLAVRQAGLQNELAQTQLEGSQEERDRYRTTFKPIEERIATAAMGFDTPERREEAARAAVADVEMQLGAQRAATMRNLERRGALPTSGRVAAMAGMMDVGAAKAKAGAASRARREVETIGDARLKDAAGVGRGVFTNQSTQATIGLQAGNSSVGNGQVPLNIGAQSAAMMGQGFQAGMQGAGQAGNIYGQAARIDAQANDNSGLWSALGNVAGMAIASDKTLKEGVAPASDEEALEAVRETPNKQWRYKPGTPVDDGGKPHVGPMAQNVAATMGMEVAPDGKAIDLVNMNGIMLGAVRALDKKLSKVAAAAGMEPAPA